MQTKQKTVPRIRHLKEDMSYWTQKTIHNMEHNGQLIYLQLICQQDKGGTKRSKVHNKHNNPGTTSSKKRKHVAIIQQSPIVTEVQLGSNSTCLHKHQKHRIKKSTPTKTKSTVEPKKQECVHIQLKTAVQVKCFIKCDKCQKAGYIRQWCRVCKGSRICTHGRVKQQCKECGGSSFCKHGRRKTRCVKCGGSSICTHGRLKTDCKECGGKSICIHGRNKYGCKECGGSRICIHGRNKYRCKECGGSHICIHGRDKYGCKECKGQ